MRQLHNWNTDYGNNYAREAEEYLSPWANEPEISHNGILIDDGKCEFGLDQADDMKAEQ